jgi:hypothetical protein
MTTATDTETIAPETRSIDGWKRKRVHEGVTLPSGFVVDVTIPNLPEMVKSGTLPNHLIEAATKQAKAREITKELLEQTWEFTLFIIPRTVVNPKIEADDVGDLPVQDLEMLASFASRTTDIDAVGHQLGGLETQQGFRDLRGLFTSDPTLGG